MFGGGWIYCWDRNSVHMEKYFRNFTVSEKCYFILLQVTKCGPYSWEI
jgi:hypothetical protein